MKITIEGEPKEIAAFGLALKDGNHQITISNKLSQIPDAKTVNDNIRNLIRQEITSALS